MNFTTMNKWIDTLLILIMDWTGTSIILMIMLLKNSVKCCYNLGKGNFRLSIDKFFSKGMLRTGDSIKSHNIQLGDSREENSSPNSSFNTSSIFLICTIITQQKGYMLLMF